MKFNVQVDGELHTNKIELTDEMGVIMKYPTIDSFTKQWYTEHYRCKYVRCNC